MTMFHGTGFYAVYSRDVGTFGGRKETATIKIYRSDCANSPACVLERFGQIEEFRGLMSEAGEDRAARDRVMSEFVKFGG